MKKVIPTNAVLIPENAKRVFKGEIFDVYQWAQKMFDGSDAIFEMLKRPDTVQAICIIDNNIIVLNEEQPHTGSRLSFPGGRVDENDLSIMDAVKREALEETGYIFKEWRLLSVRQPHPKLEWFIHTFLATDIHSTSQPQLDAGEKIRLSIVPFDDVKHMALSGKSYIDENRDVFEKVEDIQGLLKIQEFLGLDVDR